MELEATIHIPVAGATMTIPTRERQFQPGIAGPHIIESAYVADLGGLTSVELVDGQLCIELKTGETYRFPIAEVLDGERDLMLQLRETTARRDRAAFGGTVEKTWLHDLNLARLASLRLVGPEPESTPERWSRREPIGEEELARRREMRRD